MNELKDTCQKIEHKRLTFKHPGVYTKGEADKSMDEYDDILRTDVPDICVPSHVFWDMAGVY